MLNVKDDVIIHVAKTLYASTAACASNLPAEGRFPGNRDMSAILYYENATLERQGRAVRDLLSAQACIHLQDAMRLLLSWPTYDPASYDRTADLLESDGSDAQETDSICAAANAIAYLPRVPAPDEEDPPCKKVTDLLWSANIQAMSRNADGAIRDCEAAVPLLRLYVDADDMPNVYAAVLRQVLRTIPLLRALKEMP